MADLSQSHPFDTIKVRLQTNAQFQGPLDCLMQTIRKEGVNGLYKGATPPLVGWMCMDSLMLGSLTQYRRLINEHVVQPKRAAQQLRCGQVERLKRQSCQSLDTELLVC